MTSTSVVLGIARLGTPEACPGCDCATDATGSIAMRKGIINLIGSPLDSVWYRSALCMHLQFESTFFSRRTGSALLQVQFRCHINFGGQVAAAKIVWV